MRNRCLTVLGSRKRFLSEALPRFSFIGREYDSLALQIRNRDISRGIIKYKTRARDSRHVVCASSRKLVRENRKGKFLVLEQGTSARGQIEVCVLSRFRQHWNERSRS